MFRQGKRPDAVVVARVLSGKRDEFGLLVERYLPVAHAVAYGRLGNHADAEDVVQEAFIKAFRSLGALREGAKFGPWFVSIVRNKCTDFLRKRRETTPLDRAPEGKLAAPGHDAGGEELREIVYRHILALEEHPRETLLLYYYAGNNVADISALLGISKEAAKKRLQRARDLLGKQIVGDLKQPAGLSPEARGQVRSIMGAVAATPVDWLPIPVPGSATAASVAAKVGGLIVSAKQIALLAGAVLIIAGAWWLLRDGGPTEAPDAPERTASVLAPAARSAPGPATDAEDGQDGSRQPPSRVASAAMETQMNGASASASEAKEARAAEQTHSEDENAEEGDKGTISGRVYDKKSGDGIEGVAMYVIMPPKPGDGPLAGQPTHYIEKTDAEGRYRFEVPAPGVYRPFLPSAGDYAVPQNLWPVIELAANDEKTGIDFPLVRGGSIAGIVYDPDGRPLPGAEMRLLDKSNDQGGAKAQTNSDAEGRFVFRGIASSPTYVVQAAHPKHGTAESTLTALRQSEDIEDVEVRMTGGKSLFGRVVKSDGVGVGGLLVELILEGGHAWRPLAFLNATTAGDGSFSIANVPPCDYQGCVQTAPKMSKLLGPGFTMPANSDVRGYVINLGRGPEGHVAGRLTDGQGNPVPRAEVLAYGATVQGTTSSRPDGTYRIDGLGPDATVTISARGFRTGNKRDMREDVPVSSDNVDFVLPRFGRIKGRVVDGETGNPVTEFEAQTNNWGWETFASAAGEFEFGDVEHPRVVLDVRAEGYAPVKAGPYDVPDGETVDGVVVKLYRGEELSGLVVDAATGRPVEGARIKVFDDTLILDLLAREYTWGPQDPMTDADGTFRLGGLIPGAPVNLVAWHAAYAPGIQARADVAATEGAVFALNRGATVFGTVSQGGTPVAGAAVRFTGQHAEAGCQLLSGAGSDANGYYRRERLVPGTYLVACGTRNSPELTWRGRIEVTPGDTVECLIDFDACGAIAGDVSGVEDGPVTVRVSKPESPAQTFGEEPCDSDGRFRMAGLPAGEYVASALGADGDAGTSVTLTVQAGEETAVVLGLGLVSD